ncbi:peptidase domain-containing ABC transporter [Kordiimonas sp.]|uniref:peptidase domain-containing ABC transporter n=1 Tax=Kordiimonas sp. TaxID=1970157 RepID=UPI003B516CEB
MLPFFRRHPHFRQRDAMDCGAACLRMVAESFGIRVPYDQLVKATYKTRQGVSVLNLCTAAEQYGLQAKAMMCTVDDLKETRSFPAVLHWQQNHYVVLHDIRGGMAYVSDPYADGVVKLSLGELERHWTSISEDGQCFGVSVFFTHSDTAQTFDGEKLKRSGLRSVLPLLFRERRPLVQLMLIMFVGLALTVSLPVFTQAQVDAGVALGDMSILKVLLIGQFLVLAGQGISLFCRRWILVYVSSRVNHTLITRFMARLLNLPMKFFDQRNFGDIVGRLGDHMKIELFLNSNAFEIVFTLLSLVLYGLLLASYSGLIFLIFMAGVILLVFWTWRFMAVRRSLDFKRFGLMAESQFREMQLVSGVQEMRLSGCEALYRDEWQSTRAGLFHTGIRAMKVEQWQFVGVTMGLQLMAVLCAFIAASLTISGELTLGTMMAVSLVIGQLSTPLLQSLEFLKLAQDASIAAERIEDVYVTETEVEQQSHIVGEPVLVAAGDIVFEDVCFRYDDPDVGYVIDHLSLRIPQGKTTAIVGQSGCGKTTLLKLLLRLYEVEAGTIRVGGLDLRTLNIRAWRAGCGTVMQEGFIFSDSIMRNITFENEVMDMQQLERCLDLACVSEFVEKLPYGLMTRVGNDGLALSTGQKQRILIARALYKNPSFLFFDEATSALDTENEKKIVENLDEVLAGRTRVIVAHRLSTVCKADNIIVLECGKIVEQGTHESLLRSRGRYYGLVSDQLALSE